MEDSRKNVGLLAACQALLLVNNSVLITVNALAGYALATNKALATLPVTAYFAGSALAAFVIQWHMVAMFAPSFGTGPLIQRVGALPVMFVGAVLASACVAIALTGVDVMHFWFALVLLGVAWNFMYLGATTLLTETHTPAERGKVQGLNDTAISLTMVLSSLSVGALFTYQGWQVMNVLAAPLIAVCAAAILWLAIAKRVRAKAA